MNTNPHLSDVDLTTNMKDSMEFKLLDHLYLKIDTHLEGIKILVDELEHFVFPEFYVLHSERWKIHRLITSV